jgi:hypothetical protein
MPALSVQEIIENVEKELLQYPVRGPDRVATGSPAPHLALQGGPQDGGARDHA